MIYRSSYWDHYEKLCMYLFPFGWKVHGPATEESGLLVIKLVGLLYILAITFDVILAWFTDALDAGNQITVTLFIGTLVAIFASIFGIARQPQIRSVLFRVFNARKLFFYFITSIERDVQFNLRDF